MMASNPVLLIIEDDASDGRVDYGLRRFAGWKPAVQSAARLLNIAAMRARALLPRREHCYA